jgi:hypothetical protein
MRIRVSDYFATLKYFVTGSDRLNFYVISAANLQRLL